MKRALIFMILVMMFLGGGARNSEAIIIPYGAIISSTMAAATNAIRTSHQRNFREAKKDLERIVYRNHRITFYAGCTFDAEKQVDWDSCGYVPRKRVKRARRVEWEHVMPAWEFGHQLQCWQKGGRKECKKDARFNRMESDMHNLRPAVGELNGDRSNYRYGMIPGEPRMYGDAVDFEVDFKHRVAEPRPEVRGDIARTYFYMARRYGIRISKKQMRLFKAWAKSDPVDEWEKDRNCMIARLQGNANPFIGSCN